MFLGVAGWLAMSAALSGCASVPTALPDLAQKSAAGMTPEEQEAAVEEMTKRRVSHEQDAVEQIRSQRDI